MGELEVWKAGHDEGRQIETGAGWTMLRAGWTVAGTGTGSSIL
jgi:hypothetical protein